MAGRQISPAGAEVDVVISVSVGSVELIALERPDSAFAAGQYKFISAALQVIVPTLECPPVTAFFRGPDIRYGYGRTGGVNEYFVAGTDPAAQDINGSGTYRSSR